MRAPRNYKQARAILEKMPLYKKLRRVEKEVSEMELLVEEAKVLIERERVEMSQLQSKLVSTDEWQKCVEFIMSPVVRRKLRGKVK